MIRINRAVYRDKVMGCWLGKNAGGTLGEPLEEKFGRDEMYHVDWYPCLPEGGIPNDDLELQLIWLQLVLQKGPGITSADMAQAWMDCIAYNFDEYGLSKENMQKGLLPPVCGWHNNVFKDCMGSPIRSEIWACLAPGCMETVARYAWQDAIVDHGGGESVYGEIFNAVLESAAFIIEDKFRLLELALSSIPETSLTYQSVKRSIDNYKRGMGYEDNRNDIKDTFYNPVAQYSPLNLGFQTIGWLYGQDFGDAICKAVNCGWDTDCTGATLGAILGIIGGASALPEKWTAPLGYEIATNMSTGGIRNLTAPTDIRKLTDVVCREAEKVVRYWGCEVEFTDDGCVDGNTDKKHTEYSKELTIDLPWLAGYKPNIVSYPLGGLEAEVGYKTDAAIIGNRASELAVTLRNPHPVEKSVEIGIDLPDGFEAVSVKCDSGGDGSCKDSNCEDGDCGGGNCKDSNCEDGDCEDGHWGGSNCEGVNCGAVNCKAGNRKSLTINPWGTARLEIEVRASAGVIRDSNRGFIMFRTEGEPAVPAVPLVLLGGSRWLISGLYEGKHLEDTCGINENEIFELPPEGFREEWRTRNDLELSAAFVREGIIYALHYIKCSEERDVVLGVPNNGRMKLFLNGELIHRTVRQVPLRANLGNGGAQGDGSNYIVTRLARGMNQVLIKLENDNTLKGGQKSHFTIGGMSDVCDKNHGMPVLGITRTVFPWEEK